MAYTCVENVLYGVWDWKMPYKSDWEEESERMKVAYIGECDYLTTNVLQRSRKEDYDVYVLSSDDIERKDSRWKGYHHYRLTGEKEEARRIFQAVNPDIVIYEGMGYLKEAWELEQRENFFISVFDFGNMYKSGNGHVCISLFSRGLWKLQF